MPKEEMPPETHYPGSELELFRFAHNWKSYVCAIVKPHLHGDVLEVGAGLGATTKALRGSLHDSWTALEPDPELARQMRSALTSGNQSGEPGLRIVEGTLTSLVQESRPYHAILYVDVLEHIADDAAEVAMAASLLRRGGRLIVLCPAHQWLYSEFDRSIGHHRRYDLRQLRALGPPGCRVVQAMYLDSVGVAASVANRFVLHRDIPSKNQLLTWDRFLVPASRLLDPILRHRFGKSVLMVWERTDDG
jgi:protein-L-isoaspartate O-methyltransferase